MLRESSISFGYELDLAVVSDPSLPIAIPGGSVLLRLVDVVLGKSDNSLADAQRDIITLLGPEALVDAAAALGNFEMMNRIAEGTGIPIPRQTIDRETEIVTKLNLLDLIKH